MKIVIEVPENQKEKEIFLSVLTMNGIPEEYVMNVLNSVCDERFKYAIDEYQKLCKSRMRTQIKNCVDQSYEDYILYGKKVQIANCAGIIGFRVGIYNRNSNARGVFNAALKVAKKYSTKIRVGLLRFSRSSRVNKLIDKYPNLNPNALQYLYLKGKFELNNNDLRIIDTFLENLVKGKSK